MPSNLPTIAIQVETRNELDYQLQRAHESLQAAAQEAGIYGILVTRHRPGLYTASLSDQVPYGTTEELDAEPG